MNFFKWITFLIVSLNVCFCTSWSAEDSKTLNPAKEVLNKEIHSPISGLNVNIPQNLKIEFTVEKFTLANGMTFLLHENHQIPMISYQTWFRVGSKDELPGESGLAHMLEHMMFKGSKKYSNKEFDRILHENGIMNNAFTTDDYTGYYENLPSGKLEMMIDIEVDRLMNLQLQAQDLEKEREVVKEERRMRTDNDPQGTAWESLLGNVFHENNYGIPVIGTMKEINEFNTDKLKRFFAKWYVPSNAVVVFVGDFDTAKMRSLIKKYYGDLPGGVAPAHEKLLVQEQKEAKNIKVEFPVQTVTMNWGFKTVPSGNIDGYALDLLAGILGQGKSSRLFQRMVYKEQNSLAASAGHYSLKDSGMFYIDVMLKPGQKPDKIKKIIAEELKKIVEKGVSEGELQKIKNLTISDYVNSMQTLDGKAHAIALNEIYFNDYTQFFKDLDKYRVVTTADIKTVAQRFFKESRQNIITLDNHKK